MARRAHREQASHAELESAAALATMVVPAPQQRPAGLVMRFARDANGATVIEYTLIAGLTFLAIVGALRYYADRTGAMYERIGIAVSGAT